MKHKRTIEVFNENWRIPVYVIWDADNKTFMQCIKQRYAVDMPDDLHTGRALYTSLMNDDDGLICVIVLATGPFIGTPHQYSTLTHECMHAAFHILKHRGVRYSKSSEEAFTYFTDWLVENIAEKMLKVESRLYLAD
jgi:hypothetical protein